MRKVEKLETHSFLGVWENGDIINLGRWEGGEVGKGDEEI